MNGRSPDRLIRQRRALDAHRKPRDCRRRATLLRSGLTRPSSRDPTISALGIGARGVSRRACSCFGLEEAHGAKGRDLHRPAFSATRALRNDRSGHAQRRPLAVREINADPSSPADRAGRSPTPVAATPRYAEAAQRFLTAERLVHVVGCYTSSSRKEVLPLFEKHDGSSWYPSHYEGFESSENVVYTGAAPNQHIVPLATSSAAPRGKRAYCIGSNYIWAWENNKIMREARSGVGGARSWPSATFRSARPSLQAAIGQILRCRPEFRLQHADRQFGLRLLARLAARGPRAGHRPAARPAGRELQPRRARAGRDRT